MRFETTLGLLILLILCACLQQPSKSKLEIEDGPDQHSGSKSGLRIENSPNRGLNYTDTLGTKYSYRNIPITITNDNTIAIHVQIALSNEYDYPAAYGDQKFKVFLLPKEITSDKVTWDSKNYELGNNELRNFFDSGLDPPYILNETLEPGEECVITMGTLYPRLTNCGVVPKALFLLKNKNLHPECDNLINQDVVTNAPLTLGLKLDFCRNCTILPCGQISYPKLD